ncbi:hypothetical protein L6E12_33360 [Actinokineospora sp. PR83]|uniref:hypothetical protein n=1 Tax=Actinokineospora sp. PR83 TaxID=2884908 RepID=UPI001F3C8480|nr:hypothetical protein [Actinokineospora sp. PR83]MCG8920661.1 hypothetical protein [Actinokineospora sp. PR83]
MRMVLSLLLGIGGLVAVGFGVTRPWFEGRPGTELPVADLFGGVTRDTASLLTSLAAPIAVAGLVSLYGLLLSRGVARVGGALLVAVSLGWVAQAREVVSLGSLESGVWNTVCGSLLVLVGAAARKS